MSATGTDEPATTVPVRRPPSWRLLGRLLVGGAVVVAVLARVLLGTSLGSGALRTGSTVFVAVCVQALPFLVLGVLVSATIAAFVPASLVRKALPRNRFAAVGVAGLAGIALPGCECAAVPVAGRLLRLGVPAPAALAFLLASPAVNPVVLVATAVAFPTEPRMVLARFLGSLLTAVMLGCVWSRSVSPQWTGQSERDRSRCLTFVETARADVLSAGGFLVVGALTASVVHVLVPPGWLSAVGGNALLGVPVLACLAVVLALCSEADAFVAASLSTLPLLPRLVFLVVGPAVDVKLIALQAGTFGRAFAMRFAPATFVVATCSAVLVGLLVLGGYR